MKTRASIKEQLQGAVLATSNPGNLGLPIDLAYRRDERPTLGRERCRVLREALPDIEIALHFHNTRGLGGCPFCADATGNISTEDIVYA